MHDDCTSRPWNRWNIQPVNEYGIMDPSDMSQSDPRPPLPLPPPATFVDPEVRHPFTPYQPPSLCQYMPLANYQPVSFGCLTCQATPLQAQEPKSFRNVQRPDLAVQTHHILTQPGFTDRPLNDNSQNSNNTTGTYRNGLWSSYSSYSSSPYSSSGDTDYGSPATPPTSITSSRSNSPIKREAPGNSSSGSEPVLKVTRPIENPMARAKRIKKNEPVNPEDDVSLNFNTPVDQFARVCQSLSQRIDEYLGRSGVGVPQQQPQQSMARDFASSPASSTRMPGWPLYENTMTEESKAQKRKFICPFNKCYKRFSARAALESHKRVHTNEKPYVSFILLHLTHIIIMQ